VNGAREKGSWDMVNSAAIAAAKAYEAQARALEAAKGAQPDEKVPGFGELLNSALQSVGEVGKAADAGIMAEVAGKAEMADVVTAVAEAELTVQTIVAVRDRVISAYQEILRMPM
jgi:flagellar hook-basal body complex protein FliE